MAKVVAGLPETDAGLRRKILPDGANDYHNWVAHSAAIEEGMDTTVEPDTVKAPVGKLDAVVVMFDQNVHGNLPGVRYPEHIPTKAF